MVDELIGASEPDLEAKVKQHCVVGTGDVQLNVTGGNDAVQVPVALLVSDTSVAGAVLPPTGLIHAIIVKPGPKHEKGGITVMFCNRSSVYQLTPPGRLFNLNRGCQYFDLVSDEEIVEIRFHQTHVVLDAI